MEDQPSKRTQAQVNLPLSCGRTLEIRVGVTLL